MCFFLIFGMGNLDGTIWMRVRPWICLRYFVWNGTIWTLVCNEFASEFLRLNPPKPCLSCENTLFKTYLWKSFRFYFFSLWDFRIWKNLNFVFFLDFWWFRWKTIKSWIRAVKSSKNWKIWFFQMPISQNKKKKIENFFINMF